ncbi:MAG: glycosyltransferase family 2 protein [Bacteroidales bacterium]|nr:glycosyltransferase family 2 protein [Bacteroidales bacterium]
MNKISIIVPCYNQAQYLSETLESVISQTYQDWECLIVDDGSPDNTKEVAEEFCKKDNRFIYLYKENGGISSARNFGIQHSSGDYILPLDSDDIIDRTFLEKTLQVLVSDSEIKVVYTRVMQFGLINQELKLPICTLERMMGRNCIVCTALYRKGDYEKTIGYNENMALGLEDWDFWLSMLEQGGKVYQIPEVLFFYRIKTLSRNNSITDEQFDYLRKQIWLNHRKLYSEHFFNPKESFEYNAIVDSFEYHVGKKVPNWLKKMYEYIYNWVVNIFNDVNFSRK